MPALTLFGRISAFSLFVVFQAASQAQPSKAPLQPPANEVAATIPANTPVRTSVQLSPPVSTDEERGDSLMEQQRYQAALVAYSKVGQPSAAVWNKMGIAHQLLFDPKNANRCYKQSLKLDPDTLRRSTTLPHSPTQARISPLPNAFTAKRSASNRMPRESSRTWVQICSCSTGTAKVPTPIPRRSPSIRTSWTCMPDPRSKLRSQPGIAAKRATFGRATAPAPV